MLGLMKAMAFVAILLATGCADLEAQQQAQALEAKMVNDCLKVVTNDAAPWEQKKTCMDFVTSVRLRQVEQNAATAHAYAAAGANIAAASQPAPPAKPTTCYPDGFGRLNCY